MIFFLKHVLKRYPKACTFGLEARNSTAFVLTNAFRCSSKLLKLAPSQ